MTLSLSSKDSFGSAAGALLIDAVDFGVGTSAKVWVFVVLGPAEEHPTTKIIAAHPSAMKVRDFFNPDPAMEIQPLSLTPGFSQVYPLPDNARNGFNRFQRARAIARQTQTLATPCEQAALPSASAE
jgi:hypothetical protein